MKKKEPGENYDWSLHSGRLKYKNLHCAGSFDSGILGIRSIHSTPGGACVRRIYFCTEIWALANIFWKDNDHLYSCSKAPQKPHNGLRYFTNFTQEFHDWITGIAFEWENIFRWISLSWHLELGSHPRPSWSSLFIVVALKLATYI